MTPQQIDLVQRSWCQVYDLRETAATMFYERLFKIDPGLRPLFGVVLSVQAAKLFETLDAVVGSLGDAEALQRVAGPLVASHTAYGATPARYAAVGEALAWTLQASLGTLFTEPVRAAWDEAYQRLATAMQPPRPSASAN